MPGCPASFTFAPGAGSICHFIANLLSVLPVPDAVE